MSRVQDRMGAAISLTAPEPPTTVATEQSPQGLQAREEASAIFAQGAFRLDAGS